MPRRKEINSKAKENGYTVGTQCKSTESLPFSACLFVSIVQIFFLRCSINLHVDLLRTEILGNFRWCCNVLAIENSSLLCLKCSVTAFFSNFTGCVTDCYLIYIQFMSWLTGTSGNLGGERILFFL